MKINWIIKAGRLKPRLLVRAPSSGSMMSCIKTCRLGSSRTPCSLQPSAVGHLVERGERRQDAALVGFHDVSVLDHLVQDDVNFVQVEHDLTPPGVKGKFPKASFLFSFISFTLFTCKRTDQQQGALH